MCISYLAVQWIASSEPLLQKTKYSCGTVDCQQESVIDIPLLNISSLTTTPLGQSHWSRMNLWKWLAFKNKGLRISLLAVEWIASSESLLQKTKHPCGTIHCQQEPLSCMHLLNISSQTTKPIRNSQWSRMNLWEWLAFKNQGMCKSSVVVEWIASSEPLLQKQEPLWNNALSARTSELHASSEHLFSHNKTHWKQSLVNNESLGVTCLHKPVCVCVCVFPLWLLSESLVLNLSCKRQSTLLEQCIVRKNLWVACIFWTSLLTQPNPLERVTGPELISGSDLPSKPRLCVYPLWMWSESPLLNLSCKKETLVEQFIVSKSLWVACIFWTSLLTQQNPLETVTGQDTKSLGVTCLQKPGYVYILFGCWVNRLFWTSLAKTRTLVEQCIVSKNLWAACIFWTSLLTQQSPLETVTGQEWISGSDLPWKTRVCVYPLWLLSESPLLNLSCKNKNPCGTMHCQQEPLSCMHLLNISSQTTKPIGNSHWSRYKISGSDLPSKTRVCVYPLWLLSESPLLNLSCKKQEPLWNNSLSAITSELHASSEHLFSHNKTHWKESLVKNESLGVTRLQ